MNFRCRPRLCKKGISTVKVTRDFVGDLAPIRMSEPSWLAAAPRAWGSPSCLHYIKKSFDSEDLHHPYMDAPNFVKLSVCGGGKEQIAPVHSDFGCGILPLSLMGLAGWFPIASSHSWCRGCSGFDQPRSDLFAITA